MAQLSQVKPDAGLVVFTDLDGTLLDHETYSCSPAQEALDLLERKRIPLILCSSKTRAEIELIQLDLRLRHLFVEAQHDGGNFLEDSPGDYKKVGLPRGRPQHLRAEPG